MSTSLIPEIEANTMAEIERAASALRDARFDVRRPTVIQQAIIVTGQPGLVFRGDILLRDGLIAAVAPELDAAGAEVVNGQDYIVCPGFIDTHRHLWQTVFKGMAYDISLWDYFASLYGGHGPRFRPEDIYASTLLGRLSALDAGITTLLDWAHNVNTPEMEEAGIQALRDSGARSVFGHGYPADRLINIPKYHDQPRLLPDVKRTRDLLPDDNALVSSCFLGHEPGYFISLAACAAEYEVARELGMRISAHMNSLGPEAAPFASIEALHAAGLMGGDLTFVHLVGASDHEMSLMADAGVTASVAPQVDSHMVAFASPPTGRLLAAGVRPSLSADTVAAASEDFFTAMRVTMDVERTITKNGFEPRPEGYQLLTEDVFEFATLQGARALGQESRLGSIEAGKVADLLIIRTTSPSMMPVLNPVASVVFQANVGDIDTVLVGGVPVKRNGQLVFDVTGLRAQVDETVEYLYWRAERGTHPGAQLPHPAATPVSCLGHVGTHA